MKRKTTRFSLQARWTVFISGTIVIALITATLLTQWTVGRIITKDATTANEFYAETVAERINLSLQQHENAIMALSETLATSTANKDFKVATTTALRAIDTKSDDIAAAYYLDFTDGELLLSLDDKVNLDTRDTTTYERLREHEALQWLGVNEDKVTGAMLASVAAPVVVNNRMVGGVVYDIDLSTIGAMRADLEKGSSNSIMILDHLGTVVSSFIPEADGKNIRPSRSGKTAGLADVATIEQFAWMDDIYKKQTFVEADVDDKTYDVYASNINKINWKVLTFQPQSVFATKMNQIHLIGFVALALGLLIGAISASLLARRFSKTLKGFVTTLQATAKGDLTQTWQANSNDEVSDTADAYNATMASMRQLVGTIKKDVAIVDQATKGLTNIADDNNVALADISQATETIARGASEQSFEIERGAAVIQQLGAEVTTLSMQTQEIEINVNTVMQSAANGAQQVNHLTQSYNNLSDSFAQVNTMVTKLNEQTASISLVTNTIAQIAEQTNLLSLNASIEAARAGEHGKGFAVVANEVRVLAEESKASSMHIQQIINDVLADTTNLVRVMQLTNDTSREQQQAVVAVEQSITHIASVLTEMRTRIQAEASAVRTIESRKDTVIELIEDLSAISQETTATTEEISSSIEEQAATAEEIASVAKQLDELVIDLERAIHSFKA